MPAFCVNWQSFDEEEAHEKADLRRGMQICRTVQVRVRVPGGSGFPKVRTASHERLADHQVGVQVPTFVNIKALDFRNCPHF